MCSVPIFDPLSHDLLETDDVTTWEGGKRSVVCVHGASDEVLVSGYVFGVTNARLKITMNESELRIANAHH